MELLETHRVLASFEVTSLLDTTDAGDGVVTLREAIESANNQAGADTITFATNLINNAPKTITLTQGELTINEALTITGPGQTLLAIDADEMSRVTHVVKPFDPLDPLNPTEASIDVTLDGLTLTGGKTTGDNFPDLEELKTVHNGGGVRFASTGTLTLVRSTVTGNTITGNEAKGGGVFADEGSITLIPSSVINNKTTGSYADGGGISSGIASVTISSSLIAGNTLEGNESFGAGMLVLEGSAKITNSTISGNRATGATSDGGGIWTDKAALTIVNSTLTANTATRSGGQQRDS